MKYISALHVVTDILKTDTLEIRQEAFGILMRFCNGNFEQVFDEARAGKLNQEITTAAAQAWLQAVPSVTVSDVEQT